MHTVGVRVGTSVGTGVGAMVCAAVGSTGEISGATPPAAQYTDASLRFRCPTRILRER
jgi:hypothetical protein